MYNFENIFQMTARYNLRSLKDVMGSLLPTEAEPQNIVSITRKRRVYFCIFVFNK